MPMGQVELDYASVELLWLTIFSIFTTLMTITAVGVACLCRKRRTHASKRQCLRPLEKSGESDISADKNRIRYVNICENNGVTGDPVTAYTNNRDYSSKSNSHIAGHLEKRFIEDRKGIDNTTLLSVAHDAESVEASLNNEKLIRLNEWTVNYDEFSDKELCGLYEDDSYLDFYEDEIQDSSKIHHNITGIDREHGLSNSEHTELALDVNYFSFDGHCKTPIEDIISINITDLKYNPKSKASASSSIEYDHEYINKVDIVNLDINIESVIDCNEKILISDKESLPDRETLTLSKKSDESKEKTVISNVHDSLLSFDTNQREGLNDKLGDSILFDNDSAKSNEKKILMDVADISKLDEKTIIIDKRAVKTFKLNKNAIILFNNDAAAISKFEENSIMDNAAGISKHYNRVKDSDYNVSELAARDAPEEIQIEKRTTTVFVDDSGNLSIIQDLSKNENSAEKNELTTVAVKNTFIYESDFGNISVTQIVPSPVTKESKSVIESELREKVINDDENISTTEAILSNIIFSEEENHSKKTNLEETNANFSLSDLKIDKKKCVSPRSSVTIAFDHDIDNAKTISAVADDSDKDKLEKKDIHTASSIVTLPEFNTIPGNYFVHEAEVESKGITDNDEHNISGNFKLKSKEDATVCTYLDMSDETETMVEHKTAKNKIENINTSEKVKPLNEVKSRELKNLSQRTTSITPKTNEKKYANIADQGLISKNLTKAENNQKAVTKLENIIGDIQLNLNNFIKILNKENEVENESSKNYVTKNTKKPIPEGIIELQKYILEKRNFKDRICEDVTHLQDLLVYQTTTNTAIKPEKQEQVTISTSISKIEPVTGRSTTNGEKIINTDYVTVTHNVPIPFSKTDPIANDDKNRDQNSFYTILSDAKIEFVNPQCSSNCSLDINSSVDRHKKDTKKNLQNYRDPSCTQISCMGLIETESSVFEIQKAIERSILNDLLADMSDKSYSEIVDKCNENNLKCYTESIHSDSDDTLFYITKDSSHESRSNKSDNNNSTTNIAMCIKTRPNNQPLLHGIDNENIDRELNLNRNDSAPRIKNRHFEKVISSDLKNYQDDDKKPTSPSVLTLENKIDLVALPPVHLVVPRRNATLSGEYVKSIPQIQNPISNEANFIEFSPGKPSPKTNVGLGTEIVKTLRFKDEEPVLDNIENVITNPLRKNALADIARANEEYIKNRVIPSYLKDVSDGIKALMSDLTKPMADVITCSGREKELKKQNSTCSTEIQASLFSSSQIDLEPTRPYVIVPSKKIKSIIKPFSGFTESLSGSGKTSFLSHDTTSDIKAYRPVKLTVDGVIPFDAANPLNNVLLPPININEGHQYEPLESLTLVNCISDVSFRADTESDCKIEQYNVTHVIPDYLPSANKTSIDSTTQGNDYFFMNSTSEVNQVSNINKPLTVNQSVETIKLDGKEEEINTVIAMQDNKKLLENISSLTIVNSGLEKCLRAGKINVQSKNDCSNPIPRKTRRKPGVCSPLELIYRLTSQTELSTEDETKKKKKKHSKTEKKKRRENEKRDRSPNKIPKPTKLEPNSQKHPNNSASDKHNHRSDSDTKSSDKENQPITSKSSIREKPQHKTPRKRSKKQCVELQIHQVTTEYDILIPKVDISRKSCPETPHKQNMLSDSVSWDSINRSDMGDVYCLTEREKSFQMEWTPELLNELSSKNLVTECDSADVIEHIDLLPFIGSNECAWESLSEDEWVFRLLHGRLRLTVRVANSRGERARADTPVISVAVETTKLAKKNAVAELCLRFSMEAMRYFTARGCARAGSVPALLRKCAAVSRIALRWSRAMHNCWMQLAYTIDNEGFLSLNVANILLRSVWDVTMKIELVVEDANEMPWPRANNVQVTPVVATVDITPEDVRLATQDVSPDWGHAPRTLWKIFRYLENRRQ